MVSFSDPKSPKNKIAKINKNPVSTIYTKKKIILTLCFIVFSILKSSDDRKFQQITQGYFIPNKVIGYV